MRMVYMDKEIRRQAFVEKAAQHFADYPKFSSYSEADIEPGCFLALRWGAGNDCVLVVKLDEYEPVFNYMEIVRKYQTKEVV